MQKRSLLASFVFAAMLVLLLSGFAAYPDKPIRRVVPSARGASPAWRSLGASRDSDLMSVTSKISCCHKQSIQDEYFQIN